MAGAKAGTEKQKFPNRKSFFHLVMPADIHDQLRQVSQVSAVSMNRLINMAIEGVVENFTHRIGKQA